MSSAARGSARARTAASASSSGVIISWTPGKNRKAPAAWPRLCCPVAGADPPAHGPPPRGAGGGERGSEPPRGWPPPTPQLGGLPNPPPPRRGPKKGGG